MKNFTLKKFYNSSLLSLSLGARKTFVSLAFLFIAFFCGQFTNAQNVPIIGPLNGGNFQLGPANTNNNWAANSWTTDAAASTRGTWTLSTGASGNATYSAYIATNHNVVFPTIPTHAYTYSIYRSHFYRNFTIPTGESLINLSFDYLANGEAGQDYLRVWIVPTGTTPAANVTLGPASGSAPTGTILLGNYQGSNSWATANITIDPSYANNTAVRLVFEWVSNNTGGGAQFPAAIDNVVLTSTVPNNDCAGIAVAHTLTVNPSLTCTTSTTGTTISASQSLPPVCAATFSDDDVWYKFAATGTSHIVDVTPTSLVDAVFEVYSGASCAALSSIVCMNSTTAAATETATLTGLTIGNTYYVRVYSAASAAGNGTFTICVKTPCVAPTSQAGSFALGTVTSNAVPASFSGTADGFLVIQSTSATPPSQPVDGTLYTTTASIAGLGSGLTFIQSGASTSILGTGLTENTQYYYYIYAYNNVSCGGGPTYKTGGALAGNGITCPSFPSAVTTASITNTSFILNWAAPLLGGSAAAITYTVQVTTDAGYTANIAGSPFVGIAALTTTISGLSPSTPYYYRILANNGCSSSYVGSNITTLATCVAPASQAGSFALGTLTSTSVPASFTGTADGFLVIQSTLVTAPSQPVNGTTYSGGNIGTLGGSLTFIQSSASTSIAGTGLTGNTRYYYFIYAYNNTGCGGGPMYNAAGALTGNGVTCPAIPNTVTTSGVNATDFTLNWTAPTGGSASAITYTVQVTTDAGYTTNIAGSPFTAIAALTYNVTGLTGSTLYYYRVLANNGCSSAYVTGSVTTAAPVTYCIPASTNCAFSNPTDMDMITNVTLNTLNNSSACGAAGYTAYAATGTQTTSLLKGSTYNLSMTSGTGSGTHGAAVWFDFNQNGSFADAGEYFLIGNGIVANSTTTVSIAIPAGANTGGVRMRVRYLFSTTITSAMDCTAPTYGETEDYTVTLVAPAGCATPTAQPTVLSLTPVNTTINGSFTAASPAPDTYLVVVSTSNTAPSPGPVNGTSYAIGGTVAAGYTVVDTDTNTTFSATGLSANTLYYVYVYSMNSLCTGGPLYVVASPLTGSATTGTALACTPTGNLNCGANDTITNVSINTLNNTTTCGAGGYTNYAATGTQTTTLIKGSTYTFSLSVDAGTGTHGAGVWFDFNQNGSFADAGEFFLISNAITPSTTTTASITIPVGANSGALAMRVRYAYTTTVTSTMSCTMAGTFGETEDYTVNVVPSVACVTPTAQPTVLNLTPVNTTISGSFTAASPAPNSYLVVISTSNTAPAPANGSTYAIGGTVGAGYTVVDIDSNTTFSVSGLSGSTLYYVYVFSMNNICTGGPLYLTTSPLNGSTTTGAPVFCTPTGNLDCASFNNSIYNVTINTLINPSTCGAGGYTNYAAAGAQTTSLFKGGAYTFTLGSGPGAGTHGAAVWFDFNQNGSFADAGEYFLISNAISPSTSTNVSVIIPVGANTGAVRMRVRYAYGTTVTSAMSCTMSGVWGETEDYTVTIVTPTACNATTLNCGATISGTTVGSTNYYAHGTGCTLSNFGTWYTFVGDGNQSVITVTSPVGFDTELSLASGSCGTLTNITCVDDYTDIDLYSFNTTNGVTYYVYVAYWSAAGTGANVGTFTINRTCAPPYNPCSSTPAISCGSVNNITVPAGYGDYNYACGYTADGREQIFTFTPDVTASYTISQTAGYNYIYYQYKLVSAGCNSTGWTCINGLTGIATSSTFTLTAGLAYYIRIDPETEVGGTVSFTIGGKVWSGVVDTNWNNAANWIPTSIPSATDCVIIPNVTNKPVISGANYNGLAGTLTVYSSGQLTVNATNSITVTDKVNVNAGGTFTINNTANLVQVNNVANTGNIVYKRDTSLKLYDYVYWSSPVSNYVLNTIATPLSFSAMYKWVIPALNVANSNGGQGSWQYCSGDTMIAGKGYIARAPNTFTAAPSTFNGTFTGVPNNGDISFPIERGDITTSAGFFPAAPFAGTNGQQITNLSDNWNLSGNPYPSAISAGNFLLNNNTKITGTVRLWMHGIAPTTALLSNPYYTSYNLNYDGSDYYTWNFTGASCCVAGTDLYIGAGQGFFIQMLDGARASDNVIFNNSLRSAGYDNTLFYRSANNNTTQSTLNIQNLERNRIWLDINDGAGKSNRTLFGYIQGATMGNDNLYDCITNISTETQIYSLIDNSKFIIQGRSLPFNEQDEVPIGIDIKTGGTCTIGIGAVDGLFDTQNIYLKDNLLNITHDLKANPYQFTAQAGTIDDRFKVVYVNSALGNPSFTLDNNVKVLVNNEVVAVSTNNLVMESIMVYNILGQKLNTYNNINANYITLSGLHKNNTTLMLKIKLQTGETVTRKVSY